MGEKVRSGERRRKKERKKERKNTSENNGIPSSGWRTQSVWRTQHGRTKMIDLDIEANSMINSLLEKRIKQLEKQVADMNYQKIKHDLIKIKLEEDIFNLKSTQNKPEENRVGIIPVHLDKVQETQ